MEAVEDLVVDSLEDEEAAVVVIGETVLATEEAAEDGDFPLIQNTKTMTITLIKIGCMSEFSVDSGLTLCPANFVVFSFLSTSVV